MDEITETVLKQLELQSSSLDRIAERSGELWDAVDDLHMVLESIQEKLDEKAELKKLVENLRGQITNLTEERDFLRDKLPILFKSLNALKENTNG